MANQPINNPYTYSEVLRLLETTDLTHADTFNPLFARLVNNEAFIKAFAEQLANDIFAGGFVVSGMVASKNGGIATQLDVTSGICYVQQASGGILRFTPDADNFATADPSTTYYLDFQPDGTYSWGTAHSAQANYIPVAEVVTDVLGQIDTVTDDRTLKATDVYNLLMSHTAESASEAAKGHVQLATAAETVAGLLDTKAIHPAGLLAGYVPKTGNSVVNGRIDFTSSMGTMTYNAPMIPSQAPYGFYFAHVENSTGYPVTWGSIFGFSYGLNANYQYDYQIFRGYSGDLYIRYATSDTTWTVWMQMWNAGNFPKPVSGTWSDTSTLLSANGGTYTKTIPLDFNAVRGRLIMRGYSYNGGQAAGAIVYFTLAQNDATGLSPFSTNQAAYNKGVDGRVTASFFGYSNNTDGIYLQDAYITGSNLYLVFKNTNGVQTPLSVNFCHWEVEG